MSARAHSITALIGVFAGASASLLVSLVARTATSRAEEASAHARPTPHAHGLALPPADAAQQQIAAHRAAIEAHGREARNAEWAGPAEAQLSSNLRDKLVRAKLVAVDCRTHTCTALLEWPNYAAATAGYTELLHDFKFNCARTIVLPPPENEGKPYRGTALYDCDGSPKPDASRR